MLAIRSAQVHALNASSASVFLTWAERHVWRFFPGRCRAWGEERTREELAAALGRAGEYGVTSRHGAVIFINLVFIFGPDVDRQPWAQSIVAERGISGERRVRQLCEAAAARVRRAR